MGECCDADQCLMSMQVTECIDHSAWLIRYHVARPALVDGTCNFVTLLTTHTLALQAFENLLSQVVALAPSSEAFLDGLNPQGCPPMQPHYDRPRPVFLSLTPPDAPFLTKFPLIKEDFLFTLLYIESMCDRSLQRIREQR